MTARSWFKH